jgi:hypothetical protein
MSLFDDITLLGQEPLGDVRQPHLTPTHERWLNENLSGQEAIFFCRKWGRPVVRQIGPLLAIEAAEGLLLDELVLISKGELRQRFDLLAGQLESARDVVRRQSVT